MPAGAHALLAHGDARAVAVGWGLAAVAGSAPAVAYLAAADRYRRRSGRPWSRGRAGAFLMGCGSVLVALSPPLEGHPDDLRPHVVQHLLLGMYAPVGLVLGAPITLLLGSSAVPTRARIRDVLRARAVRVPTHLAAATALNVVGTYALYLTPLYALSVRSGVVHWLVHAHVVLAGCAMAWAVAGPDPAPGRPSLGWRLSALVVAGGAHAFLAKLLFSRAPTWPPGADASTSDVEVAAQWMYYGGHLAEAALLVALFAGWYRRVPRTRVVGSRRVTGSAGPRLAAAGVRARRRPRAPSSPPAPSASPSPSRDGLEGPPGRRHHLGGCRTAQPSPGAWQTASTLLPSGSRTKAP